MQSDEIVAAIVGLPFIITGIVMGVAIVIMIIGALIWIIKSLSNKFDK